jgi:DNA-binding Lrp family transcriptional regulator
LSEIKLKVLELLHEDSRRKPKMLATMLDVTEEEVNSVIHEMEQENVIVKYATVINWTKLDNNRVTALIEVQITPERGRGFDAIAERVYVYPEVKSVYLMSGGYDLLVEVEGKTLLEVANFVSSKLSPIDSVLSTKTHFILKKYKQDGIIFENHQDDDRLLITP